MEIEGQMDRSERGSSTGDIGVFGRCLSDSVGGFRLTIPEIGSWTVSGVSNVNEPCGDQS
jgi:hypothetical protein